ncbi:two-component system sensor histidine kinase NtrB [Luteimonas sp. SDU82]|uniref:two-component system sensor histidine kinase NtrB n=1 Tax=Luteimonas sp. SDU82 TaxID=3422592 RepID=UPI003EB7CDCE
MQSAEEARTTLGLGDPSRQFALLLNSVTDYAIYMLDDTGHVRSWNPGGERIKGYSADEIVGSHFSRFYSAEDAAAGVPERNLHTARTEGRYVGEGWRLRKDGSRFHASVVIDPIFEDGRLVGFAKITRDITERYEAEQRLERTRHSLLQSQKMEAIGKLTLGLAHDFNNLLTIIINSLDVIDNRVRDERVSRMVETAMRASERGVLLSRQLLTFGRGQNLAPERLDINTVIRDRDELLRRCAGDAVEFSFELAEPLPEVDADAGQLEAALLNLVSNSRDAMVDGGRIHLRTFLRDEREPGSSGSPQHRFVCVEVTDTGPGIPFDHQTRVFEPFFTTKEVGKGSGLGLSQVFGFASQSGGGVDLSSTPGAGTSLVIRLPVAGGE